MIFCVNVRIGIKKMIIQCGLVFAVNANECLLTRMQEMSLDYHFTVEQEVGSATHAFFGFNGKFQNIPLKTN